MSGSPAETFLFCKVSSFPQLSLLPNCLDNNFTTLSNKNLSFQDFQLGEFNNSGDLTVADSPLTLLPLTNQVHHHYHAAHHPKKMEMVYWIFAAVVFVYVRKFVARNILLPLGRQLGVKDNSRRVNAHILDLPCSSTTTDSSTEAVVLKLEKAYRSSGPKSLSSLNHKQVQSLSDQTGLESRVIERWLRRRAAADKKPSDLVKFMESGWRLICYISATTFGLFVLWDKPWLWDITEAWKDYPYHGISNDIWWYYCFTGGEFISLLITLHFDVKRKDYWEMVVHHCIAISLLVSSWSYNLTRCCPYGFLLHDVGDVFLESAKVANYCKRNKLATGIFVIFTLVWVVTRLLIFPHQVIYRYLESGYSTGVLSLYGMAFLLCLVLMLLGLHVFWTYFIIKTARSAISSIEKAKDSRSSSEEEEEEEEEESISEAEVQGEIAREKNQQLL